MQTMKKKSVGVTIAVDRLLDLLHSFSNPILQEPPHNFTIRLHLNSPRNLSNPIRRDSPRNFINPLVAQNLLKHSSHLFNPIKAKPRTC